MVWSPVMSSSPTNSSRNSRRRLFGDRRVAGEQRPLDHLGQVDQGEHRAVEVGEVPPEDVGLVGVELLGDVDGHRASRAVGGRRSAADRRATTVRAVSRERARITSGRANSVAAPPSSTSGSQPEVGHGHGHRLGPVEHGRVAVGRRRRSRRTPACGSRRAAAPTLIIGWIDGHDVADVAHVGAADHRVRRRSGSPSVRPSAGRVGARRGRRIGALSTHVGVDRLLPLVASSCSRRQSAPASRQASTRGLSALEASRASASGRTTAAPVSSGTMFGLSPAVGEDAVDALARADVLAQRGHVHVAEHGGVERVAALLRERRGVGGLAVVGRPQTWWTAITSMRTQVARRRDAPSSRRRRRRRRPRRP